jgi:hypothetical protein
LKKRLDRAEVYLLFTGKHPEYPGQCLSCNEISKLLGVSKQRITVIKEEMIKLEFIKFNFKKGKEKIYKATGKEFDKFQSIHITPRTNNKSEYRSEKFLQKARYEIVILSEKYDFFKDKKKWMRGNCPHSSFNTKVFDNFPNFEFTKVGNKRLIVTIPGMSFKNEEFSIAKHTVFWVAFESLKYFSKISQMKLDFSTLRLCQKPHICSPAKAPWAKRVARGWSLKINNKMLDNSSGKADWECNVFDDDVVSAIETLDNWDNIGIMQGDIKKLQGRMDDFEIEILPALQHSIDTILKETMNIKKLFKPKLTPDDSGNLSYS